MTMKPMRMGRRPRWAILALVAVTATLVLPGAAHPATWAMASGVTQLAVLDHGSGSTIGPDGALYVTQGTTGEVLRIDRATGEITGFTGGLPRMIPEIGIGGPIDIAFLGDTAYVLVTLVG